MNIQISLLLMELFYPIYRQNRPKGHEAVVKTSRAVARDFSLRAEGVNNKGRVSLRSVLYSLYLKHDQKIDRIRKNNDNCLYLPYDRGR